MNFAGDALVERLARLEAGQVSDVLDEAGLPNQVVDSRVAPLAPGARLAGRAACLRGEPLVHTAKADPASLPGDALEILSRRMAVVVISTGGLISGSCLGGFVAASMKREGCAGVVLDGPIRDAEEIRATGLATFCTGVNPVNGARRWRLREMDVAISLPGLGGVGVRVEPGDFVLADADGIVVVPARVAQAVIEDAEELQRIEGRIGAAMSAGTRRVDAFAANPRFGHIRRQGGR